MMAIPCRLKIPQKLQLSEIPLMILFPAAPVAVMSMKLTPFRWYRG
jgi:hypothetical protein